MLTVFHLRLQLVNGCLYVNFVDLDVISGRDTDSIMDVTQTRNLLIDELLEVILVTESSFLNQSEIKPQKI